MSFHVTVQGGEDDGKSFLVDGQCVIGRGPGCQIILTDPQVSWEHAALQDVDGRLFLQNLSAAGVRVQGKPVTNEVRLGHGEEIELTADSGLVVEERVGGDRRRVHLTLPVLIGIIVVFGVILLAVGRALQEDEPPPAPMTIEHWRTAHRRLAARMEDWEVRGEFPGEAIVLFEDAWRLEIAQNVGAAAERWDTLRSLVLTLPIPGGGMDQRTIAESAGTDSRALDVIMDWAPDTSMSMDPRWRTDEAFADALSWFVQKRALRAHEKLEAGR
jgi:hypothetical protein